MWVSLWLHPRDPMCGGYGPMCRTHTRLGLLCEGLALQCCRVLLPTGME